MADIIKGYKVEYAPYAATAPTTNTWVAIANAIKSMPNLFPLGATIDTTTIDCLTGTNTEGLSKTEGLDVPVIWSSAFETAHEAMVADQSDNLKGYFWFRLTALNRKKTYTFKSTVAKYLPTPEGEAGALDEFTIKFYPQSDIVIDKVI